MAQVREVFRSSKFGVVAGCLVTEGAVKRNNPIRVLRDNVVIFEGALESLRRFKDDVSEVRAGTECGIGVKNYQDVRVNDQIECYSRVEVAHDSVNGCSDERCTRRTPARIAIAAQIQRVLAELLRARGQGSARRQRHDHGGERRSRHGQRAHLLPALRRAASAEEVRAGLRSAAGFLRGELARRAGAPPCAAARVPVRRAFERAAPPHGT